MSATAPREIELKLEVDPDDLDRLRSHPLLEPEMRRARTQILHSTYFDTPDHALQEAGVSLRLRSADGCRIQTVKADRAAAGLVLNRQEWEHEVAADMPDFTLAEGTALDGFGDR